jgi:hypothetical protein
MLIQRPGRQTLAAPFQDRCHERRRPGVARSQARRCTGTPCAVRVHALGITKCRGSSRLSRNGTPQWATALSASEAHHRQTLRVRAVATALPRAAGRLTIPRGGRRMLGAARFRSPATGTDQRCVREQRDFWESGLIGFAASACLSSPGRTDFRITPTVPPTGFNLLGCPWRRRRHSRSRPAGWQGGKVRTRIAGSSASRHVT